MPAKKGLSTGATGVEERIPSRKHIGKLFVGWVRARDRLDRETERHQLESAFGIRRTAVVVGDGNLDRRQRIAAEATRPNGS
jgi:hypothetical protein